MDKAKQYLLAVLKYCRRHGFTLFVVFIYLFFTVYYVGLASSITDCGNTLNGLGDNSAGPIWKAANTDNKPIGGYSSMTNYPQGESLNTPIDAVVAGQSLVLWATAKIAGPICGYNLTNMLGYISSALVMYAFIYVLTRGRKWIALLAGYVVAFSPFFQAKVGGHPSYGFEGLLIGIVWAFWSLVTTRKKSRAIILAVLSALCFYFDPYFSLMAFTILIPLVTVWLVVSYSQYRKKKTPKATHDFKPTLKRLMLSLGIFGLLIMPVLYVMTSQSSQIKSATAGTRDDIQYEARIYSNMPSEYLLPYKDSPLFKLFGSYQDVIKNSLYVFSNGNLSEDSVGLSLVMVFVIILFAIIASWEKLQGKKLHISSQLAYDARLVLFGALGIAFFAFLIALPPVHFMGIPLPSYILLKLTSIWRVISREYVVVNIGSTIMFVVAIVYFTKTIKMKKIIKGCLYGLLFLLIFVQYQTYHPFQGLEAAKFSYSNAPVGYTWLRNQGDIKAIAEYPIEKATEANSHGYYMSMQLVHKKALLNSAINDSPEDSLRDGIKNLSDPQTVPTLHALGIDAIVIHGIDASEVAKVPNLTVVYSGTHGWDAGVPGSTAIAKDVMVIAKINPTTPLPQLSLRFLTPPLINSVIQTSSIDWRYEVPSKTVIGLKYILSSKASSAHGDVCFAVKMSAPSETSELYINGNPIVLLTDQYQQVRFPSDTSQDLKITVSNGHDVQLTQLGC